MDKSICCPARPTIENGVLLPVRLLPMRLNEDRQAGVPSLFLKDDGILFSLAGRVRCQHGGDFHLVEERQFIFFRRGTLLEWTPLTAHTSLLLITVEREQVLQFAEMSHRDPVDPKNRKPIVLGELDALLSDFCHALAGRLQQNGNIPRPLVRIKILELMFLLSNSHPDIADQMMDCRDRTVPDIPSIIEEKLMDDVPLPQLARLAGRSVSSFRRDFLTIYNMAPSRWIRQKKLEKAQHLLTNTSMTITEVCYLIGFQSNAHFSRIFKSYFGYPPSGSRRQGKREKKVN